MVKPSIQRVASQSPKATMTPKPEGDDDGAQHETGHGTASSSAALCQHVMLAGHAAWSL